MFTYLIAISIFRGSPIFPAGAGLETLLCVEAGTVGLIKSHHAGCAEADKVDSKMLAKKETICQDDQMMS